MDQTIMMDISIIILNYKSKGLIKQQLLHLAKQITDFKYEVIVIDNDSKDGIQNMLVNDFPAIHFIQQTSNLGFAAGNNAGISQAQGRYILIANPDIVLDLSEIKKLLLFMGTHEEVGLAGPQLVNADNSLQYSAHRFFDVRLPLYRRTFLAKSERGKKWLYKFNMRDVDHTVVQEVDWLYAACLIVRKSALVTVGLLDERFFMYIEDTDWCRRFWENGYKVYYVPTAKIMHLHRRSSQGSIASLLRNRLTRQHMKSFIQYLWKYRGKSNPHH